MFSKNLFKAKAVEKGYDMKQISNCLGISESTLYRKMSGNSDFTRNEIQLLRQFLSLSMEEIDAIFFAA